jgi:hypothetical protein
LAAVEEMAKYDSVAVPPSSLYAACSVISFGLFELKRPSQPENKKTTEINKSMTDPEKARRFITPPIVQGSFANTADVILFLFIFLNLLFRIFCS